MIPIFDGREMILRTLTMLTARDAVKMYLRVQGHAVLHYKASEFTAMAEAYLAENRAELVEVTRQRIMASPELRDIWETEGRKYETASAARARLAEDSGSFSGRAERKPERTRGRREGKCVPVELIEE